MKFVLTLILCGAALAQNTPVFPGRVATTTDLPVAVNNAATTLTLGISSSATSATVNSATGFVAPGLVTIDSEIMAVCQVTGGNTLTFGRSACPNIDGRGVDATVAASHLANRAVQGRVTAMHTNQLAAEMIAVEGKLHKEMVSVRDFGAKGDGVTDDSAAVQAMLTSSTTGVMSFGGPGTYKVSSTVTLTVPVNVGYSSPGPIVDFGSSVIKCVQTSGPCIHILSADINGYQGITIRGGTFLYAGSSSGVSGLLLENYTRPDIIGTKFIGFSTSGSIGMNVNNVEEAQIRGAFFTNNTLGLYITGQSTANLVQGCTFQANAKAMKMDKGSYGNTFSSNVFQSGTGVHSVEIFNSTGDPDTIQATRFHDNHFEGNGDGTANSRAVYLYADATRYILTTRFDGNVWNTANGAATAQIEFAGSGVFSYTSFSGNQCSGGIPLTTGAINLVDSRSDNCTLGTFNVGVNTGGFQGVTFWGPSASKKYLLSAGSPGDFDGFLRLDDITSGSAVHLLRGSSGGLFSISLFPLDGSQNVGSSGNRWPYGYFTNIDSTNLNLRNAPIAPLYRMSGYVSGGSPTWADLQSAITAAGTPCTLGSNQGMMAYVIDGNNSGYGNIVSGGGGVNSVFLVCDGSNWRIH